MTTNASQVDGASRFFQQGTWLGIATICSGVFMLATQFVAIQLMDPAEYGVWFALLRVYLLMSIPAVGMQIIFAQQAAAAVSEASRSVLAHTY